MKKQEKRNKIPQDIIGDIAILKFPSKYTWLRKKLLARRFLKTHPNINTILEKTDKIKGRLRKAETKFLAGEKKQETIHIESGCKFKLNIQQAYFSPRLSAHRQETCKEIAKQVPQNKKTNILIMFSGIAPWPIILASILKKEYPNKKVIIYANEINQQANKYAKENIKLNKLDNYIRLIKGDAKKLPEKLNKKFNIIIMPRPNLKETFLKTAKKLSKKGTIIYYHGFGKKEDVGREIKQEISKSKIKIKKAGEIAPYKFRWLAKFKI
ncbi:MAG: hypothetical protein ACP5D2_00550 [Candidatus Nanoarchaeia archaeon]